VVLEGECQNEEDCKLACEEHRDGKRDGKEMTGPPKGQTGPTAAAFVTEVELLSNANMGWILWPCKGFAVLRREAIRKRRGLLGTQFDI
jgi:hypothetical protein